MSCTRFEDQIALYVEGDLPDAQGLAVHLEHCADCRGHLEALAESQAALKDLRHEPVDPAVLAAVRARVMERVMAPRRIWGWRVALAAVAAAVVLVALLEREPVRPIAPLPKLQVPAAVPPPPPVVRAALPPKRRARPRVAEPEPLVVKIVTDDPDIVIYWIADNKENRS